MSYASSLSFTQYARFLAVGGFVGLITLAVRELIARVLYADTPFFYSVSVVLAYTIGIMLSFSFNRHFTFRKRAVAGMSTFVRFVLVALVGMVLTWLLSVGLRYGFSPPPGLVGHYWPTISFGLATVAASGITYPLNATLVF